MRGGRADFREVGSGAPTEALISFAPLCNLMGYSGLDLFEDIVEPSQVEPSHVKHKQGQGQGQGQPRQVKAGPNFKGNPSPV